MTAQLEVNNFANANINDSQEALVAALELALVENLDGHNRGIFYGTLRIVSTASGVPKIIDLHVKILIPVRVERLFDHAGGMSLLAIDRNHSERIWETKDLALG